MIGVCVWLFGIDLGWLFYDLLRILALVLCDVLHLLEFTLFNSVVVYLPLCCLVEVGYFSFSCLACLIGWVLIGLLLFGGVNCLLFGCCFCLVI